MGRDYFLKISREYPGLKTVNEHLDGGTMLSVYLSNISFANRKQVFKSTKYIGFRDDDSLDSRVVLGTSEILLKFRLSKKFGVNFLNIQRFKDSFRKMSDFLSFVDENWMSFALENEIGKSELERLNWITQRFTDDSLHMFDKNELLMSLFLFQAIDFERNMDTKVFRFNWMSQDFFRHEVEMICNRAEERIYKVLKGSKKIDFFPEFGKQEGIVAECGILFDEKLINLCVCCSEDMVTRESSILKFCCMLNDKKNRKLKKFFVYGMRDGQLIELS